MTLSEHKKIKLVLIHPVQRSKSVSKFCTVKVTLYYFSTLCDGKIYMLLEENTQTRLSTYIRVNFSRLFGIRDKS